MRSEPLLFGATILVTLLVSCHSRVMLDKFWVEARHPVVVTKSIRDIPIQEVEPPTASRTTQNYILSPSKMSQDVPRYKNFKVVVVPISQIAPVSNVDYKNFMFYSHITMIFLKIP